MNQNNIPHHPRPRHWVPPGSNLPTIQPLARAIADASTNGVLFFLAVELELRLKHYFTQNKLPPTAVDLEIMLADASKALLGE